MIQHKIIGSNLEVCLRTLLLLSCMPERKWDEFEIATCDYICLYAKDYDIGDYNLHGTHFYRKSEFCHREVQTKKAIKSLVIYGLMNIHFTKSGYKYSITSEGLSFIKNLNSNYAMKYLAFAAEASKLDKKTIEKWHRTFNSTSLKLEENKNE